MSWPAVTWARDLKAGGPARKCLLLTLAECADDDWKTWRSQQRLAEITEQSVDSVRRHLRDLEAAALIFRIRRRRPSGAKSSDMIVLLGAPEALAYAASHGWKPGQIPADDDADPEPERVTNAGDSASPDKAANCMVADADNHANCGGAPSTRARSSEESFIPDSPQSPPLAAAGSAPAHRLSPALPAVDADRADGIAETALARFEVALRRLVDAYPPTAEPADRVRREFGKLSIEDRDKAIEGIATYRAGLGGRRPAKLRGYLRERLWDTTATLRKAGVRPAGDMVFVVKGTPAFEAWERHEQAIGKRKRAIARQWDDEVKAFVQREVWIEPFTFEATVNGERRRGYWRNSLFPPRRDAGQAGGGESRTESASDCERVNP